MAGHALCVNESMMLGDATYARSMLRRACALPDPALQQMAVEMLTMLAGEGRRTRDCTLTH